MKERGVNQLFLRFHLDLISQGLYTHMAQDTPNKI